MRCPWIYVVEVIQLFNISKSLKFGKQYEFVTKWMNIHHSYPEGTRKQITINLVPETLYHRSLKRCFGWEFHSSANVSEFKLLC